MKIDVLCQQPNRPRGSLSTTWPMDLVPAGVKISPPVIGLLQRAGSSSTSLESTATSSDSEHSTKAENTAELLNVEEENPAAKAAKRKIDNRLSAARSRERKKRHVQDLEEKLQEENMEKDDMQAYIQQLCDEIKRLQKENNTLRADALPIPVDGLREEGSEESGAAQRPLISESEELVEPSLQWRGAAASPARTSEPTSAPDTTITTLPAGVTLPTAPPSSGTIWPNPIPGQTNSFPSSAMTDAYLRYLCANFVMAATTTQLVGALSVLSNPGFQHTALQMGRVPGPPQWSRAIAANHPQKQEGPQYQVLC